MNKKCGWFCPSVAICSERHKGLTDSLSAYENSLGIARLQRTEAQARAEQAGEKILWDEMELDWLGGDAAATGVSAENAETYRSEIAEYSGIRDRQAAEASTYRELMDQYAARIAKFTGFLEQSHAVMAMIDEAKESCRGPRLTFRGYMVWRRAKLLSYLQPNKPAPPEAYIPYLMQNKGYVRCTSELAKTAMRIDVPTAA